MQPSTTTSSSTPSQVRRQKFGLRSFLFLLIVGVALLIGGVVAYKASSINANWDRVNGIIVGVQTIPSGSSSGPTYIPTVKYVVQEQNYTISGGSGSSRYPIVGRNQQVAFDPNQPGNAKLVSGSSSPGFILIIPVVGTILVIAALIFYSNGIRQEKDSANLRQSAQKSGIIADAQFNTGDQQTRHEQPHS